MDLWPAAARIKEEIGATYYKIERDPNEMRPDRCVVVFYRGRGTEKIEMERRDGIEIVDVNTGRRRHVCRDTRHPQDILYGY